MITVEDESLETIIQEKSEVKSGNLDYLYETARKGNADSMLKVAQLYRACAKDENDYKKAYEWALMAKESGKKEAFILLGDMHQLGQGCRKSAFLARLFYKMAAKDGITGADKRLQQVTKEAIHNISGQKLVWIYGVICILSIVIAVTFIIKKCSGPAHHLVDSVINKALTVQDADALEANGNAATDGIVFLDENTAEYEKYHFATEEEVLAEGYTVCQIQDAIASSEQVADVGAQYGIQNTYDGKLYTNWQEAESDAGIGQSLTYTFQSMETIHAIGIYPGNGRSEKAFAENNRPEMITFQIGKSELQCYFPDENGMKYIILDEPFEGDTITLTIDSVYQGKSEKNLTCITEIVFYQ